MSAAIFRTSLTFTARQNPARRSTTPERSPVRCRPGIASLFLESSSPFRTGSIKKPASEILEEVLKDIKQNPSLYFIIESHRFSIRGTGDDDFEITRERANAIVDWLVAKGIPARHLQLKPFGRMKPLTDIDDLSEIE